MTPSKPETLLELVERLDREHGEPVDLTLEENFEATIYDEWPRLSKAIREMREKLEEAANYDGNGNEVTIDLLLMRLDGGEVD